MKTWSRKRSTTKTTFRDGEVEDEEEVEEEEDWNEETPGPFWRERRFLLIAGGFAAVALVLVVVLLFVTSGGEEETAAGLDTGEGLGEIEFDVEEVDAGSVAGDVESLWQAISALESADRVELLQQLGISERGGVGGGVRRIVPGG